MVYNPNKNLKLYYSIAEVAERFGVSVTLLRFWEQKFPQIAPHKAGRGVRQYTEDDIKVIGTIYQLVKVRGLKLEAAAELLRKNKEGTEQVLEALAHLREIRERLVAIKKHLTSLQ